MCVSGKRVRRSFRTRRQAEEFERSIASSRLPWRSNKRRYSAGLRDFAVENFETIWSANRRPDWVRYQLKALYEIFGENCPIDVIDTVAVDTAIRWWRASGLASSTINHRLSVLSKLLKYAVRTDQVGCLPAIQRQRVNNVLERVWTEEDERNAFAYLDHVGLVKTRCALQFLLYTGARKGEAYLLRRVDVRDGWVRFSRETTKSGKTREIPLVPKAKEAWDYLCAASDLERPLQVISKWTLRDHWELLRSRFDALDDRAFVPHMLRHTCATRLVAGGVPLPQVMKWMGHQSIQVTLRYVYVAPKDLEFAATVLSGSRTNNRQVRLETPY